MTTGAGLSDLGAGKKVRVGLLMLVMRWKPSVLPGASLSAARAPLPGILPAGQRSTTRFGAGLGASAGAGLAGSSAAWAVAIENNRMSSEVRRAVMVRKRVTERGHPGYSVERAWRW